MREGGGDGGGGGGGDGGGGGFYCIVRVRRGDGFVILRLDTKRRFAMG
jgi:hypothetical protein